MNFDEKLFSELERLHQKIDRLEGILTRLPIAQNLSLGDWISEDEVRMLLNRGPTSLWTLRKTKKVKSRKMGNRIFYSRQSIIDYLDGKNK